DALQRAVRVGQELGRGLLDRVVLRAVRRRAQRDGTDVERVAGDVAGQGGPRPGAVLLGVEAVVRVAVAPADRQDHLRRVLGVDRDVGGDVLVRRVRVARLGAAGQERGVRRELQLPRARLPLRRVRPHTVTGGRPYRVAGEAHLADHAALQLG